MPRPSIQLDSVETPEGLLELRKRGDKDFMILVGGRVLMTSILTTSELALAENGCAAILDSPRPRVLIGGLGLGFTLQAALAALPRKSQVVVAELNEKVVEWCRGPVAEVNGGAALDRRVEIVIGDVTEEIRRVAEDPDAPRYDAILWDLYIGPTRKGGGSDPLYGDESVERTSAALRIGGVFGVWSETPSPAFAERMKKAGLLPEVISTRGGGLRHAVILATKRKPNRPKPKPLEGPARPRKTKKRRPKSP
jgi:spermidine synthase